MFAIHLSESVVKSRVNSPDAMIGTMTDKHHGFLIILGKNGCQGRFTSGELQMNGCLPEAAMEMPSCTMVELMSFEKVLFRNSNNGI